MREEVRNYCTLFDMNYAAKAMALRDSLQAHSSRPFQLWALAMDWPTYVFLNKAQEVIPGLKPVAPEEVMQGPLAQLRHGRTRAELCFTCTPFIIEYAMLRSRAPVMYMDADASFFADPEIAFNEIGHRDVALVPHNFPAHDYARLIPNGRYNVNLVYFRNSDLAIRALSWWRDSVVQKCDRQTVGDQLYLNEFPSMLGEKLHEYQHPGITTAPWNMSAHHFQEGPTVDGQPLVMWHYHELKRIQPGQYHLTGYPLSANAKAFVYEEYVARLESYEMFIHKLRSSL